MAVDYLAHHFRAGFSKARRPVCAATQCDEAKLVSRLAHPSIVKVYEQAPGWAALHRDGAALRAVARHGLGGGARKRGPRLSPRSLRSSAHAWPTVCRHAHELEDDGGVSQEVVHRDIDPSNIFIAYGGHRGDTSTSGSRRRSTGSRTMVGVVKGKLAYMAPEQVAGPSVDRRTDLFALGTTLWFRG